MKIFSKITIALAGIALLVTKISAASTLLPPAIQAMFDSMGVKGSGAGAFVSSKAQFVGYAVLGAITTYAVFFTIKAAKKYIDSEGDPGKVEEAQKALKAIIFGIAFIFIGIVAIVLTYVVFNQDILTGSVPQVCLSAAESVGCKSYYTNGIKDPVVVWCEGYFVAAAQLGAQKGVTIDPTDPKYALAVGTQAAAAGYGVPPAADGVSIGGIAYPDPVVADANENAALLCINPIKGGYLPTNK